MASSIYIWTKINLGDLWLSFDQPDKGFVFGIDENPNFRGLQARYTEFGSNFGVEWTCPIDAMTFWQGKVVFIFSDFGEHPSGTGIHYPNC